MSQEEPPIEIIINGVIGWDERSITTNNPYSLKYEIFLKQKYISQKFRVQL